jgi:hypothetical protein
MTRPWLALLTVAALSAPATTVAHEFGASRQVLVDVTPTGIEVLITWSLGASAESRLWDQLLDANQDGRVDGPLERLAASRALLPYALTGLGVRVGDAAPALSLVRVVFEPAPRTDTSAGWRGAVLLRATMPIGDDAPCTPIAIERLASDTQGGPVGVAGALSGVRAARGPSGTPEPLPPGESIRWCVRAG